MGVLRVVQLNAGTLLEGGWADRRVEVVAWLERLEPDVVCLQEVWQDATNPNTAGWIVDQLSGEWHWRFGGGSFDPALWRDESMQFGSAILSRWPIDAHEVVLLPVLSDTTGFVAQVPWELLHVRTAGLDVFSTHLASAPTDNVHRRVQVVAVDEHIKRIRGGLDVLPGLREKRSTMPPILCGDFNAEPDSDEIRFLSSLATLDGRTTFYQDAWRVAGDDGPGYTQDWRSNPIAAALNVHRKRIDYVFVGDPFQRADSAGRVLSARVVFDTPLTGVIASDHAGLVVEIAWPGRPGG